MKEAMFEQQLMHGVYMLGRQRDAVITERKRLAKQIRYNAQSVRLEQLIQHYEFGVVLFAVLGALIFSMGWKRNTAEEWWLSLIGLGSVLVAFGIMHFRDKIAGRKQCFDERYQVKI